MRHITYFYICTGNNETFYVNLSYNICHEIRNSPEFSTNRTNRIFDYSGNSCY